MREEYKASYQKEGVDGVNKKSNNTGKNVLVLLLVVIIIVSGYFFLENIRESSNNTTTTETEAKRLLDKDLNTAYPATPREVVKLYSRYTKCLYSGEVNDKEIEALANQVYVMYDEELIANNPLEDYIFDLKLDIAEYQSMDRKITSYKVDSSNNAVNWTEDGIEYARMIASYTTKEGSSYMKTQEEYLLRKDNNSKWKILGFREMDSEE